MGFILVARNTHQDMDCFPDPGVDISNVVWDTMSLYKRLVKEKNRLAGKALRFPKTKQELLDRQRWERVYSILTHRYEYGMERHLDDLKREEHGTGN